MRLVCASKSGALVGREVIQNRVDIGPEASFVEHKYPGEEIIYAVSNVGSGNAAELATYVVEQGKPFLVAVE
jgi:nucleoside phosphorylase